MVQESLWSVLNPSYLPVKTLIFGVERVAWSKCWLWSLGVLFGRHFWGSSVQVPAQSRIMNNSSLLSVAWSVESWNPLRSSPNHLADVFSYVQSEPPKLLLVIPKSLPPGLCNVSSALVSMWLSLGSLFVIQNKPRSITSSQTSHSQGPMPFNWLLPGSQIPFPPGGLEIEHSISGFSLTSIVFPLIALLLALPACSESLYSTWQTVWSLYLSH